MRTQIYEEVAKGVIADCPLFVEIVGKGNEGDHRVWKKAWKKVQTNDLLEFLDYPKQHPREKNRIGFET